MYGAQARYNDSKRSTIFCRPNKSYGKMYGAQARYNDIPGLTI